MVDFNRLSELTKAARADMDYEKIIHICEERIRQIDMEG